jgi:hypothetical protein
MRQRTIGLDMSKWYITKAGAHWRVLPPFVYHCETGVPRWSVHARSFDTGAEALAAFAAGEGTTP